MHYMFGGSLYLFAIIKYFSFAFFPFICFAMQLFSTLVTSSNLCNQALLFMELHLLQGIAFDCKKTVGVLFSPKNYKQPAPLNVFRNGVQMRCFDQAKYLGIGKCLTEG